MFVISKESIWKACSFDRALKLLTRRHTLITKKNLLRMTKHFRPLVWGWYGGHKLLLIPRILDTCDNKTKTLFLIIINLRIFFKLHFTTVWCDTALTFPPLKEEKNLIIGNSLCSLLCRLGSKWISLWSFGQLINHYTYVHVYWWPLSVRVSFPIRSSPKSSKALEEMGNGRKNNLEVTYKWPELNWKLKNENQKLNPVILLTWQYTFNISE